MTRKIWAVVLKHWIYFFSFRIFIFCVNLINVFSLLMFWFERIKGIYIYIYPLKNKELRGFLSN
jgi:hypothetical protein